jgi:Xaa-Pro aminopeptidase
MQKRGLIFRILAAAALAVCLWPAPLDENIFAVRRDRLRAQIHGQAILYSGSMETVGLDKNFYYLAGLAVSHAFLLLSSDSTDDRIFLDPSRVRLIPEQDIIAPPGISFLFDYRQIDVFLGAGLASDPDVYFPYSYSPPSDPAYLYPSCMAIEQILTGHPSVRRNDEGPILYPLRMVKDDEEIGLLQETADITGRGVLAGMRALRPGLLESELQGVIEDEFLAWGASGTSFASIVGSGPNSLILHYEENTRRMEAGEVVVVDVGAEFARYAGDITRTLPVSGVFTARQREVYNVVLECQRRAITACRPNTTLSEVHAAAQAYAEEKGYGDFFNYSGWRHGTSHHLGLDVHDPSVSGAVLEPGMVITVEPGIYIPGENLGIRIEDDVLITGAGCVIISDIVPRQADEIEAVIAGAQPLSSRDDICRRAAAPACNRPGGALG